MSENTARRENGRGRRRPRGYAPWSPHRRTWELMTKVGAVLDTYQGHLPLTVRQIFYRLVATAAYPKTEAAYASLCEALVRARRARWVPFEVLRDDGVVVYSPTFYGGIEDFADETAQRARGYRRDRQARQPAYFELWCEAAGMAPQLARVAERYSVPVFSNGGFTSLSAVRLIAERAIERDVPTMLLHVGDIDPSGASIFSSMVADAAAFVEADRVIATQRIEAERVTLTVEQVAAHDLPTVPPKASDSRSASWVGGTCQAEALAPDVLAEEVERAILRRLDLGRFQAEIRRESGDRAQLLGLPAPGDRR